jgi:hypothetical protein
MTVVQIQLARSRQPADLSDRSHAKKNATLAGGALRLIRGETDRCASQRP